MLNLFLWLIHEQKGESYDGYQIFCCPSYTDHDQ